MICDLRGLFCESMRLLSTSAKQSTYRTAAQQKSANARLKSSTLSKGVDARRHSLLGHSSLRKYAHIFESHLPLRVVSTKT